MSMSQLSAYDAGRSAAGSQGVVERFRPQITSQKKNMFPEVFQRESEILEASVARYEKICAEEIQWAEIKESMSQDPAIAPYLYAADGHPRNAVRLARADVEYWKCLKHSGWKTKAQRKRSMVWRSAKMVLLPLFIVLVTALMSNIVASSIQDRAFQKQKFFDAKFQRLREGQQRSVALVARLRTLREQLAGWERFGGGISPRQMLVEYREEIEQIRALGLDSKGGGPVSSVAQTAQQQLDSYISCLDNKVGQQGSPTSTCSDNFNFKPFEALTLSFVNEISVLGK
jgi:hypothetical protein